MLRISRLIRSPIVRGTGEFKAGQGRIVPLQPSVPLKPGISTPSHVSPLDDNDESYDHESSRNPETGEWGGPSGPEPTRHGDWHKGGRCTDF